jgi:hypothetical protein
LRSLVCLDDLQVVTASGAGDDGEKQLSWDGTTGKQGCWFAFHTASRANGASGVVSASTLSSSPSSAEQHLRASAHRAQTQRAQLTDRALLYRNLA